MLVFLSSKLCNFQKAPKVSGRRELAIIFCFVKLVYILQYTRAIHPYQIVYPKRGDLLHYSLVSVCAKLPFGGVHINYAQEGAAILSGIAYNGKNDRKEDLWDGVRYVHLWNYEFGLDFQSVIDSFNVGTNTFAKK